MLTSELANVKFLLVDDREENLFAFARILGREGVELVSVRSGRAALEALLVHDFALAIIDVQMPEMDGIELAELMRGSERTMHVPIILVTAGSHERSTLFRGHEAGVIDFLHKPIEPVVLRNKAEVFFVLHRQKQELGRQLELWRQQQRELERTNQALVDQARLLERRNDELAAAQDTARRAKEVAEAANRAKDEFLANVSHEIRTPMNAILGMTELVLDTEMEAGQRRSLVTVKSAAENLLGTIDDLLDFSKIEAGKLDLSLSTFSLRTAVEETMRTLATRAHRKGLELVCDLSFDMPDLVIGDVLRLRQVLFNLVGNAVKFTERGEVVLEIRRAESDFRRDHVRLHFAVRDTGIGISRDKQETIFRAFEQADMSTTRRYGGTGLGLTIAARLIGMMSGDLQVESEAGQGSAFTFTIALGRYQLAAPDPEVRPSLGALRVLLVEDNSACRRVLESWLGCWGLVVTPVNSRELALEALARGSAEPPAYDLILLDGSLPDPGPSLIPEIRRDVAHESTRIVLMTSGEEEHRRLLVDACLPKPLFADELWRTIDGTTGGRARKRSNNGDSGDARPRASAESHRLLRVLVAEDNEFNSELLQQLLVRRGHRVRIARTGREALRLVEADAFDVLLLDVHMPELDGFGVIHAIRERERSTGHRLPVVAVTARARGDDRTRCLDAGMDDFLIKPVSALSLWATIERVVARA